MANPNWKAGVSGNPAGRPKKGKTLTDLLTAYLGKKPEGDLVTRKQKLVEALFDGALPREIKDAEGKVIDVKPGDPNLLKYIFDRIDGKPDVYQHITTDETPLIVITGPEEEA
jgi:hypothetical protein